MIISPFQYGWGTRIREADTADNGQEPSGRGKNVIERYQPTFQVFSQRVCENTLGGELGNPDLSRMYHEQLNKLDVQAIYARHQHPSRG